MTKSRLKFLVPKSKIPPIYPLCPACGAGTRQQHGTAFAEGYHRRHICRNAQCGAHFYTLSPYGLGEPQMSGMPFKDRALTELERYERDRWWEEENSDIIAMSQVFVDIPGKMARAIRKPEEEHDDVDSYLAGLHEEATRVVQILMQQKDSESG